MVVVLAVAAAFPLLVHFKGLHGIATAQAMLETSQVHAQSR